MSAEQEAIARLREDMMDGEKRVIVNFLDLRALLDSHERMMAALEDCLHELGNHWHLFGVPPERWDAVKNARTRGDLPGKGEYAMNRAFATYAKAREALEGKQ